MRAFTLTEFVDIVVSIGMSKVRKINAALKKEYDVRSDYYKIMRDHIVDAHKKGLGRKNLDRAVEKTSKAKKGNYFAIATAYKEWWGKKKLEWFPPPTDKYNNSGVVINVNPELGLIIKEEKYVIKLYFKKEPLSKSRVDVILQLMDIALNLKGKGITPAILDIKQKKLFIPTVEIPDITDAINAELAYIKHVVSH